MVERLWKTSTRLVDIELKLFKNIQGDGKAPISDKDPILNYAVLHELKFELMPSYHLVYLYQIRPEQQPLMGNIHLPAHRLFQCSLLEMRN